MGLKAKDVITQINGQGVPNTMELRTLMRRHRPGETIKLTIKRGQQTFEVAVTMISPASPALDRQRQMNSMGVGVSDRSDDFPAVIQHDTVVKPTDCGGPVVDLSGKIVGVNIAHAGRTETYCLPTDVVLPTMYELMSGRLSPTVLEVALKASAEKAAAEKAATEKAAAERKAAEEKAAEKAAAEKKAAEEKAAAEKKAAEKAAAEKKAAEVKAAEKAAAEKKAAEEKAAAEKKAPKAAEKKAAEEKAARGEEGCRKDCCGEEGCG